MSDLIIAHIADENTGWVLAFPFDIAIVCESVDGIAWVPLYGIRVADKQPFSLPACFELADEMGNALTSANQEGKSNAQQ